MSDEKRKSESNLNSDKPSTKISKQNLETEEEIFLNWVGISNQCNENSSSENNDDYMLDNCKNAVKAFKENGSIPLHSLIPQPSLRSYTKENKEIFWNDPSIKLTIIGTSGGDRYMFYLYRDDDDNAYDIYTNAHNKYYVSHKYEKKYVEPPDY